MSDDLSLAALLGEAPKTPDPGFRFDVLARVSARAARREAWTRGLMQVAAFTAVGLLAALVQFASVSSGAWIPVLSGVGRVCARGDPGAESGFGARADGVRQRLKAPICRRLGSL